nr:NAD-dependent deacylase [Halalkalibacter krulwichiae]
MFQVAEYIKASSKTVVFTGAGMSTESGIPDFRSRSGWWKQVDPRTVATIEALEQDYPLFHEFYSMRMRSLQKIKPHDGHNILAEWEKRGLVHLVATQNVDGLHQEAGSQHVEELHGSIKQLKCQQCEKEATTDEFLEGKPCSHCGGKLRTCVVLFGEALPQQAWKQSFETIKEADVVIVIGTSLEVYPAGELPFLSNGKTILINLEEVENDFDVTITGKAKETLQRINELLVIVE